MCVSVPAPERSATVPVSMRHDKSSINECFICVGRSVTQCCWWLTLLFLFPFHSLFHYLHPSHFFSHSLTPLGNIKNTEPLDSKHQRVHTFWVTAFDCGKNRAQADAQVVVTVKPSCKPGWIGNQCHTSHCFCFTLLIVFLGLQLQAAQAWFSSLDLSLLDSVYDLDLGCVWAAAGMNHLSMVISKAEVERRGTEVTQYQEEIFIDSNTLLLLHSFNNRFPFVISINTSLILSALWICHFLATQKSNFMSANFMLLAWMMKATTSDNY